MNNKLQTINTLVKTELELKDIVRQICAKGYLAPLWLVPLVIGIFLFPISGTTVTPDGATYLSLGYNLYNGLGYIDSEWNPVIFRGPVFPGLLAVMFGLFGVSIQSGVGLVRLFFVLNGLLTYAITTHFTNRLVGLFASLLLLTSTTIYVWSTRIHYDNIVPFFMLVSCYLFIVSMESQKRWIAIVAGILLGCGFLTKDSAILVAPLPIVLWLLVPAYRKRKNLIYLVLFLFTLILMAGSWFAYVYTIDGLSRFRTMASWVLAIGFGNSSEPVDVATISDAIGSSASSPPALWEILIQQISAIGSRLQSFYEIYIEDYFAFSFLFICSWFLIFVQTIRKRSAAAIFLIGGFLLFLPIVLLLGEVNMRSGQNVFLYILSYVALSYILWHLAELFPQPRLLFCIIVIPLLCIQMFFGQTAFLQVLFPRSTTGYISQLGTNGLGWKNSDFFIRGWHDQTVEQAGVWLHSHVAADEKVLTDWERGTSFYLYLEAHQPIHEIKYIASQNLRGAKTETPSPINFMWTQAGRTDPSASLSYINAFSETLFLSEVREQGINYVIFGERRNFLSLYLRFHPDFIQAAEFDNGRIQIFKIVPNAALKSLESFPLFISNSIEPYLRNMRNQQSINDYEIFKQRYFYTDLNLSEADIQNLESGSVPIFRYNTIFSHKEYATTIQKTDLSLFLQTIEQHKQQAINFPTNPWVHISLAYLYQANGQNNLAQKSLAQALSVADSEPLTYPALIDAYSDLQPILGTDSTIEATLVNSLEQAIELMPNNVYIYWQLANLYQRIDDSTREIEVYERALSIWPESAGTMSRMARYYQKHNHFEKAKAAYQSLLTMSPDDQNLPDSADIHIEIGKIFLAQAQGAVP